MSENYVRGEESGHARLGMFDMLPLYVMDGNITSAISTQVTTSGFSTKSELHPRERITGVGMAT